MKAVAIDGPAGAGKSTVARAVARELGWLYVDTGAMYRALAWAALDAGLPLADADGNPTPDIEDGLVRLARRTELAFDESGTCVFAGGRDVSAEIRSPDVTAKTRFVARAAGVRAELVGRQRAMAAARPVVMEGRDIGLAVLPDARWKFFMTASPEARAARRAAEMRAAGAAADEADILRQQRARDAADEAVGPLKELKARALAGDGVAYFDTTGLSAEEAAARVAARVRRDLGGAGG